MRSFELGMESRIVYLLIARNAGLQAKKWKQGKSRGAHGIVSALQHEARRVLCGMVWDIHLFRTSMLVTRTPLTTLRCLSHKYVGHGFALHTFITNTEASMMSAFKGISEDLSRAWKLFLDYR